MDYKYGKAKEHIPFFQDRILPRVFEMQPPLSDLATLVAYVLDRAAQHAGSAKMPQSSKGKVRLTA